MSVTFWKIARINSHKLNSHVSWPKKKESTPTCSISHLHATATCQETGPHRPDWHPLFAQLRAVFLQRMARPGPARHGTAVVVSGGWVTVSAPRPGQTTGATIGSECKGRVNCSVFRQLAPRWANGGPAGQLSRSQWVWLWDIPRVLLWPVWNPQGKHRLLTPWVTPTVPRPPDWHVVCQFAIFVWCLSSGFKTTLRWTSWV